MPRISIDIVDAIQFVLHARSHQRIVDQIAVNQEQSLEANQGDVDSVSQEGSWSRSSMCPFRRS